MIRESRFTSSLIPVVVITLACSEGSRAHLPALTDYYARVDNTLIFELPDSGGFLVNGVAVERTRIRPLIGEVFRERRPDLRAVFVIDNPARDWADVALIQSAAKSAGGEAFDAKLSNRLPLRFTEIKPIERH